MNELLKYEFRKTLFSKLVVLGIAAVLEIVFLIGYFSGIQRVMAIGGIGLAVAAVCGILWIGLDSLLVFQRDLNTKQSYMLFMTPNSSYRILGAKMLENGLSLAASGLFFFLIGLLDMTMLSARYKELDSVKEYTNLILNLMNSNLTIDAGNILLLILSYLSMWICTLMLADLGIVLSNTLFSGKKWNVIFSFLIFIGLLIAVVFFINRLPAPETFAAQNIMYICLLLGITVAFFFLTSYIMDRKLSV